MATSLDWSGLLTNALSGLGALGTANSNKGAANTFAGQTQYNPYNISTPNSQVGFSGNNATASLSPAYQGIQGQLTSGASGLLGGLGTLNQNGGINPYLQGTMDQYNQQSTSGPINPGTQTSLSTGIGDQFNSASSGFLGALGSFNPQDAASSYTNNLRAQALPQQQQAAQSLAQNLFNTGRLGSTGGANLYGQLTQAQNQQDLGFQLAGQQYGGQEQSRIAGLGQSLGQAGTGINAQYGQLNNQFQNDQFNRNIQSDQYTNQRAQQRFQNAMSLFGSGLQNQQVQQGNALGLLQGAQGLDQNLLQAIGIGGTMGAQQSNANKAAYNPALQAGVAQNNTVGAGVGSLLGNSGVQGLLGQGAGALGSLLGSLFGGSSSSGGSSSGGGLSDYLGGYGGDFSTPQSSGGGDLSSWWNDLYNGGGSGGFSAAGGEAAGGDFSGNGTTGSWGAPATSSLGSGIVGDLKGGLGLLNGIQAGGSQGYGQALASGANLAASNGLISGEAGNAAGIVGNAASGNYAGALKNVAGLASNVGMSEVGSGAYANSALADAGFGSSAGGSSLASTIAGSGLSTAIPLAALGFAAANFANSADKKDAGRRDAALSMLEKQGWTLNAGPPGKSASALIKGPDGQYYNVGNNDNLTTFARAITSGGSQQEIQDAWQKFLSENVNTKYKGGKIGG